MHPHMNKVQKKKEFEEGVQLKGEQITTRVCEVSLKLKSKSPLRLQFFVFLQP